MLTSKIKVAISCLFNADVIDNLNFTRRIHVSLMDCSQPPVLPANWTVSHDLWNNYGVITSLLAMHAHADITINNF